MASSSSEGGSAFDNDELFQLVKILYVGGLFCGSLPCELSKNSMDDFTSLMTANRFERDRALAFTGDRLDDWDLEAITLLWKSIASCPLDYSKSHDSALQSCFEQVKRWLANSDESIGHNSKFSHKLLKEKLNTLINSDYFTHRERNQVLQPAKNASVEVLWELDSCKIPVGYDLMKIYPRIISVIRDLGFLGPVTLTAFGDLDAIAETVGKEPLNAFKITPGITLVNAPKEMDGFKCGSSMQVLNTMLGMLQWSIPRQHIMLISGDGCLTRGIECVKLYGHNVIVVHLADSPDALKKAAGTAIEWESVLV